VWDRAFDPVASSGKLDCFFYGWLEQLPFVAARRFDRPDITPA
jgi:hypothetical protein